ncbi:hypothetical protein AcW1_001925 [Taiwanofungus camphoratus]|nr:hypothetical protein AcV5_000024 [Antrodia cinnamomea]KAI0945160.1 hypothetical protein AcV7_001774 [Antrodia cinnamomea]KAI0945783.1 hypothetical protein AcW1_001925 [Antrodia cinnamomea]
MRVRDLTPLCSADIGNDLKAPASRTAQVTSYRHRSHLNSVRPRVYGRNMSGDPIGPMCQVSIMEQPSSTVCLQSTTLVADGQCKEVEMVESITLCVHYAHFLYAWR